MEESKEVAVQKNTSVATVRTIGEMKEQVQLIQRAMAEVMHDKQHYGTVPGCGDKKVLLKPGAEKLSLLFRLAPHFEEWYGGKLIVSDLPGGHKSFEVHCAIVHIPTDQVFAIGVGICSTMESKYRYRNGNHICPYCQKETIYRSKKAAEGWFCWKSKGGCGATFLADDEQIISQKTGRKEHDNPADYYNTCIKIGKKRAYVDGIVSATACGDIFTQDLDRRDEEEPLEPLDGYEPPSNHQTLSNQGQHAPTMLAGEPRSAPAAKPAEPPAPAKASSAATPQAVEGDVNTERKTGFVEDVQEFKTVLGIKYIVSINGNRLGTFDENLAKRGRDLKKTGAVTEYISFMDGKYPMLYDLMEKKQQPTKSPDKAIEPSSPNTEKQAVVQDDLQF